MQVVLIHIGDTIPDHFFDCAEQVRRFFPGDIHVVLPDKFTTLNAMSRIGLHPVPSESLTEDILYKEFKDNCYLKGFWNVTAARLVLLEILMRKKGLKEVIHIENDVLIYENPDNMLNEFKKYAGNMILINPVGDHHASAAYCFIPHIEAIAKVNGAMVHYFGKGKGWLEKIMGPAVSEMKILCYMEKYENFIKYLPIVPEGKAGCGITMFKSVFDSATIGQHVDGTPWKPGVSFHDKNSHWVAEDLEKGKYKVGFVEHKGLNVPFLTYGSKVYRINNLHIHSKRLKRFI
jgi:hypothetical protein